MASPDELAAAVGLVSKLLRTEENHVNVIPCAICGEEHQELGIEQDMRYLRGAEGNLVYRLTCCRCRWYVVVRIPVGLALSWPSDSVAMHLFEELADSYRLATAELRKAGPPATPIPDRKKDAPW